MWGESQETEWWRGGGFFSMGDQGRAKVVTSEPNEEGRSHEAM